MSYKPPYVSDQYKHLLNPQYIQSNPVSNNQYFQQYQQYPQQNAFLPGPSPAFNHQVNQRPNQDSYAANEPNSQYQNINQSPNLYPELSFTEQTPLKTPQEEKQIIHKVEYGDTLQGLSLIYDVSISKLKQRNKIDGDSIYYLKEIIIPNPKTSPLQMAKTQQYLIEEFVTYMPREEKSQKVARYYLGENQWNVNEGVKAFKEDLEWQRKNKVQIKSIPIKQAHQGSYDIRQQLLNKKYL